MNAIDIAVPRILQAEGFRAFAYDDATGQRVRAPQGNLTWLYGCNLDTEGNQELGQVVARWKLEKLHAELLDYAWYDGADGVRQSVPLEIAFNGGLNDILHYPHFIAAYARQDWPAAAAECTVSDPRLQSRYAKLAQIILTGVSP